MKSEIQIQRDLYIRMWNELPESRDCIFHIANEAKRTQIEWMQLKASGFRKGIQDMPFIWNGKLYMIEFKSIDGKIDPYQKAIHCAHSKQGILTWIFKDHNIAFEFAKYICQNGNHSTDFNSSISKYALRPDMYSIFALEAKQSDCKHKGIPCSKCNWVKGSKLTIL